jgi:hypothetical protein
MVGIVLINLKLLSVNIGLLSPNRLEASACNNAGRSLVSR